MNEIKIYIDPTFPNADEIGKSIKHSLDAFDTLNYQEETVKKPAGELFPGLEQVVAFIIEHHDKIIEASIALINLLTVIIPKQKEKRTATKKSSIKKKEEKKKTHSVILEVNNKKLKFPCADSTKEKFLKDIEKIIKSGVKDGK